MYVVDCVQVVVQYIVAILPHLFGGNKGLEWSCINSEPDFKRSLEPEMSGMHNAEWHTTNGGATYSVLRAVRENVCAA